MTMERAINKTQRYTVISLNVTGQCVEDASSKCRTMSYKLRKLLASILGVDYNVIEIVKPMYITGGLSMDILVYANDTKLYNVDHGKVLKEANESDKLQKIVQQAWQLRETPLISDIRFEVIESDVVRSETERAMMESKVNGQQYNMELVEQPYKSVPNMNTSNMNTSEQDYYDDEEEKILSGPPPPFNPNAKLAKKRDIIRAERKRKATQQRREKSGQIELEMAEAPKPAFSQPQVLEDDEGGGAEGDHGKHDAIMEKLKLVGYRDEAQNLLAIQSTNGELGSVIQFLDNLKKGIRPQSHPQNMHNVALEVNENDEEGPPPPQYNPNAKGVKKQKEGPKQSGQGN